MSKINPKSIAEKAILVSVSINMPGQARQNRQLTEKVKKEKDLGAESGRWLSQRFPSESLKPFNNISQEARGPNSLLFKLSLPFRDGSRMLPMVNFQEINDNLRKIRDNKFWPAVEKFGNDYPNHIEWAKENHKEEFQADDYPNWEILKEEFGFNVHHYPLPTGNNLLVQLEQEEFNNLREQIDNQLLEACQQAKKEIFQRMTKPIIHLCQKLKEKDSIFRDSIVSNIREMLDIIPTLNLIGDADVNSIQKELKSIYNTVLPEKLREDEDYRNDIAAKSDALVKKLQGYF